MQFTKAQLHLLGILLAVTVTMVVTQVNESENEFPTHPLFEFPPLNRSTMLRAKAILRWLIDNRTENATKTFNAGFIRLIFHDCVGGCDGCVSLLNPSNSGLGFYKLPLDLLYRDFIFPWMSRADWYALAGVTAVEYAAELTPCEGPRCKKAKPEINFLYGRRDCVSEANIFRFIPGPTLDPRFTIRNTFRLNFAEITALMGAHCLGKNHQRDTRWVDDGTKFNNQYYKDMLADHRQWKRGNGTTLSEWTSESTGNVMLSSDMFMAFDVSNTADCTGDPMNACNKTNTFQLVQMFAEDNEFWMREFAVAFNVMLMNGNFGRLKQPVLDTMDQEWTGEFEDLFPERNPESDYTFDPSVLELPETVADTPTGTNAETRAETPAETAAETPAETAAKTPAETASETPAETPVETAVETPSETVEEVVAEVDEEPQTASETFTNDGSSTAPETAAVDTSTAEKENEASGEKEEEPAPQPAEQAPVVETAPVETPQPVDTPQETQRVAETPAETEQVVEPELPVKTASTPVQEEEPAAAPVEEREDEPTTNDPQVSSGVKVQPSSRNISNNQALRRRMVEMLRKRARDMNNA